jgi:hypothetical protein
MKTPIMNTAFAPLRKIQSDARDKYDALTTGMDDKAIAVAIAANEIWPPRRFMSVDVTPEKLGDLLEKQDCGIAVHRDELSGWLGSMQKYNSPGGSGSSADRAAWLQAYDGGSYEVDRIRRGELRIKNFSASVIGGIQPDRLAELKGIASDGLIQRFLPCVVQEG